MENIAFFSVFCLSIIAFATIYAVVLFLKQKKRFSAFLQENHHEFETLYEAKVAFYYKLKDEKYRDEQVTYKKIVDNLMR